MIHMLSDGQFPAEIARFRAHLRALAAQYQIHVKEVRELPPHYAAAGIDVHKSGETACRVLVPTVASDAAYAVVLHEFGHYVSPRGHGISRSSLCRCPVHRHEITAADYYDLLTEEVAAWDWARATALDWTPGMQQTRDICTQTYVDMALQRAREETAPPVWTAGGWGL